MDMLATDSELRAGTSKLVIARLVDTLDEIERRGDSASWEKATAYVTAYEDLADSGDFKGLNGQKLSREIHNRIRAHAEQEQKQIPRPGFFANARKLADTWEEIFSVNTKDLPYDHYRLMAVCGLPRDRKDELRSWAEKAQPTQAELRQTIRHEVDAYNGDHKPDFEHKVSNFWKFNSSHENGSYGGIHPAVVANLVWWFTEPGDTVIDPMAGTGILADTLGMYRFFRETYEAEGSGERVALMSDIAPTREGIERADAREGLPFYPESAQLAIIDPPYLRVADGKRYANLGYALDEWLEGFEKIAVNTLKCLEPGGRLAVITDDVLRQGEHIPIAFLITGLLSRLGLDPAATIYNHNPNFVYTMGPAQMKAAVRARVQCNGCKIIQVASKPACRQEAA